MSMLSSRRVGTLLILLSSAISILWGLNLARNKTRGMTDFRAVYFGSRCLIENRDPYNPREFLSVFLSEGGEFPSDSGASQLQRRSIPFCINLPTSLLLTAALAWMGWSPAHAAFFAFSSVCLILAALLVRDLTGDFAPGVVLFLVCAVVANCEVLLSSGDLAGPAVCLCVMAVWCFLRNRFAGVGVVCLAVSLVIKPHDAGLVWLFFLLAGATHRKRALQTLAGTLVLAIPAFLWASHVSPSWIHELQGNLAATSARGDIRDPGPTSASTHELEGVIDLQSVISVFRDDPQVYNSLTYFVCGGLLAMWSVRTLTSRISPARDWIALAAIVPLTMLLAYHRPYDAKLLLLTIPGCAMLWAEGGVRGKLALTLEILALTFTADIPAALIAIATRDVHQGTHGILEQLLTILVFRTAALTLIAAAIYYLYVYLGKTPSEPATDMPSIGS